MTAAPVYQHPDGASIGIGDYCLTCTDTNGKTVSIPIGPDGLVMLGMRLIAHVEQQQPISRTAAA